MAEPPGAAGRFWTELRELYAAAGEPTLGELVRQGLAQRPPVKVSDRSLSDWLTGKSVPDRPRAVAFLTAYLQAKARALCPRYEVRPAGWWQELHKAAVTERHAGRRRGGRPVTQAAGARTASGGFSADDARVEPVLVGVIPRRADCFQDRETTGRLHGTVGNDGKAAQTHVLTGTGGEGKTQLAAAYTRQAHADGVQVLVWANAASRDGVVSAYADAAVRLNLALADREDQQRSARAFLAWAETTPQSWLVVLDDVRQPADLNGLWPSTAPVPDDHPAPGPATDPAGNPVDCAPDSRRVVVTTRLRAASLAGADRRTIDVGVFIDREARAYLRAKLAGRAPDPADIDALADDLGRLPLALAQAATYITNQDITCAEYRRRLAARRLDRVFPRPPELPDDHEHIIEATWDLSIDQAGQAEPVGLARPVLYLASMLDPNGIPQAVLTSQPARDFLARYLPSPSSESPVVSSEDVDEALRTLHRYSLIDHDRTAVHREIRIHQLVQRATRENLTTQAEGGPDQFAMLAEATDQALDAVWPDPDDGQLSPVLRANAFALQRAAGPALWNPNTTGLTVLLKAANSLGESGQIAQAVSVITNLTTSAMRHLGSDHLITLVARNDLANFTGMTGDATGAVTALEQLLTDQLRVLRPDHGLNLAVRNSLAHWREAAGDTAGAGQAFEELFTDLLRWYGPDDPETLKVRHYLADWRAESGDAAEAVVVFEELVAESLQVIGPDHIHTFWARDSLSRWRGRAGDAVGAAAGYEELLTDELQTLWPDHPRILYVRGCLAHWHGATGDAAGAITALEGLLADQLRVLGHDHVDTRTTRDSLAHWRSQTEEDPAQPGPNA